MGPRNTVVAPICAVFFAASAAAARQATFTPFPDGVIAWDVSADGAVVVGGINGGGGAFRWTAAGGSVSIGSGGATSVSADGTVVGGWAADGSAFRWTAGTGQVSVMTQPFGATGLPYLSGDGSTIAYQDRKWSASSGTTALPIPPGYGNPRLQAIGLSYDGSVIVGGFGYHPDSAQPFRWSQATGTVLLGQFPGQRADGAAMAINPDGSVLAGSARTSNGYDTFRWTQPSGLVALNVVSPELPLPFPRDMTPDGDIIVGTGGFSAFVWRGGTGSEVLQDVLVQRYGLDLGGFELVSAQGISADGRTIVGWGTSGTGFTAGWVVRLPWSIPAPGASCVLLMAAAAASRRRRA